jgi:hypothetical protein
LLAMGATLGRGNSLMALPASTLVSVEDKASIFTPKDCELIIMYFEHFKGTLAPGSLDRSTFSVAIEKFLVSGSRVPMQLEKSLEPLPGKLESTLSLITGDYARYKLGQHILMVKKADLTISDILKNVAPK